MARECLKSRKLLVAILPPCCLVVPLLRSCVPESFFEPNDALLVTPLEGGEDTLLIARLIGAGLLTRVASLGVDDFLRDIRGLLAGLPQVPLGVLDDLWDIRGLLMGLPVMGVRLLGLSQEMLFECLRGTCDVDALRVLGAALRGPSDLERSGVAKEGRVFAELGRGFRGLLVVEVFGILVGEISLRACMLLLRWCIRVPEVPWWFVRLTGCFFVA